MGLRRYAGWMLGLLPLLGGCKGFWDAPSNSGGGGCTTNCSTSSSGNFYVLNTSATGSALPQIVGGTIASGKFANISGSPWNLANTSFAVAVSPNGAFLYVSTAGGINVYPINTSGALGTPSAVSSNPALALQVDTTGNWLIEAVQAAAGSVTMAALPISKSQGTATGAEVSSTYSLSGAVKNNKIAVSPDDKYVFVAMGSGGTLALPFSSGAAAGVSPFGSTGTVIPVVNSGGSAVSVAVDPGGHLVFVGEVLGSPNGKSGGLRVFDYTSFGTSKVTEISGSPMASGGTAPNAILPKPSGNFVYVANGTGPSSAGNITSFSISSSGSGYTVTSDGTAATGILPVSLAEDSSGTYVFSVNSGGNPFFNSYTFDATTQGKLDPQNSVNTGATPLAIVAP